MTSIVTMLSRVLGFIRDTCIARHFGAGIITDAFFIAFRLPNLLRRIFAEGVFCQIFLSTLSKYRCCANTEEVRVFISRVSGILMLIISIIICIGLLEAPRIIISTVPGINNSVEKFSITVSMFRIMFPYILLISLASLIGIVLNTYNIFIAPSLTPIFLNLSMISFMLFSEYLYCHVSIIGLAWSVIVGGGLQCIYCMFLLKKIDMLVYPKIHFNDNRVCRLYRLMIPAIIVVSSSQISFIINIFLASFLQDGSISWMYYADRLMELPIGVFGVTLTTILSPYLSRCIFKKNYKDYFNIVKIGIRLSYVLSMPCVVILCVLSKPLVITLFKYGKFSEFDVLMTQYSVIAYAIGLPALILIKVLTSAFYARSDIRIPIYIVMITMVFAQVINISCIHVLKHVVFSVSVSLSAWFNAGLLYWIFKKKYYFCNKSRWFLFFSRIIISIFVMLLVCLGLLIYIPDWSQGGIIYRFIKMIMVLVLVISSYCVVLWCVGIRVKDFVFLGKQN
ncbi:murein biosynthesis integral membrane protein MurJ [Candidatus Blochmannia ocreatus]|uniref:Probable lipid II flippase MurJ n=2 Tax=Candidatus Blochmannia ocreatus (nom. nud.) TaxID=251538 RepID=A0ABY4SU09_9ENTR|nr:murein biosynthesis integral membrane protein MurJ [Candidatus Blochmannia ocreatus]